MWYWCWNEFKEKWKKQNVKYSIFVAVWTMTKTNNTSQFATACMINWFIKCSVIMVGCFCIDAWVSVASCIAYKRAIPVFMIVNAEMNTINGSSVVLNAIIRNFIDIVIQRKSNNESQAIDIYIYILDVMLLTLWTRIIGRWHQCSML